jgi:hypothetical protein
VAAGYCRWVRDVLVWTKAPRNAGNRPARGLCLEPHDCVLAKLAAGREKDYAFAAALPDAGLIDVQVLTCRNVLVRTAVNLRAWHSYSLGRGFECHPPHPLLICGQLAARLRTNSSLRGE